MVIQSLLRTKMLDLLNDVRPKNKWKILIVDESSLKIINSAFTMSDLTDHFVLRVESIFSKGRAQSREHEVIYFISPALASIHKIIEDLVPENPKYAKGHVFLTEKLPTNLSRKLRESRSMVKIGILRELYVNFTAIEKRAFTLNLPQCLKISFNPSNVSLQKYGLQKIAKSLASILLLMNENPEVRYYGPPKVSGSGDRESPAKLLAEFLRHELDSCVDQQFSADAKSKTFPHTNMLIVDRTIDMLSPVIHNSTYMGLLVDLLDFDNMGVTLDDPEHTRAELNDMDSVWQKMKYMHIANAMEYIASSLKKFASENKVAQWSKAPKGANRSKDESSLKQIEDMKDTITQLPKYHELASKYNLHTSLCKSIMNIYNSSSLDEIIKTEQDIAIGSTVSKGSPPGFKDIMALFESGKLTKQEIQRILIAYFAVRDGIPDSDRSRLESYFSNDPYIIQTIHNMSYMGIRLSSSLFQMMQEKSEPTYHRGFKGKGPAYLFENDRYIPILKDILENFMKTPSLDNVFHLIPPVESPFSSIPRSPGITNKAISGAVDSIPCSFSDSASSLMSKNKASWASKRNRAPENAGAGDLSKPEGDDIKTYGSRIIVFILGGVSCAELRAAHELMVDTGREIIIGSTNLVVPSLFINEIENLNLALDSSDLFGIKSEAAFLQKRSDPSFTAKHSPKAEQPRKSKDLPPRSATSLKYKSPLNSAATNAGDEPAPVQKRSSPAVKSPLNVPVRSESRLEQKTGGGPDKSPVDLQKKEEKKKKLWKFL